MFLLKVYFCSWNLIFTSNFETPYVVFVSRYNSSIIERLIHFSQFKLSANNPRKCHQIFLIPISEKPCPFLSKTNWTQPLQFLSGYDTALDRNVEITNSWKKSFSHTRRLIIDLCERVAHSSIGFNSFVPAIKRSHLFRRWLKYFFFFIFFFWRVSSAGIPERTISFIKCFRIGWRFCCEVCVKRVNKLVLMGNSDSAVKGWIWILMVWQKWIVDITE